MDYLAGNVQLVIAIFEDYFDEFGVQMPEEVKFQNIYLIGKNLYDCFSRMIPV